MQAWHKGRFQLAIEHLYHSASRRRFAGELTLAETHFHRRIYSRNLARLVRASKYQFAPAEEVPIRLKNKERTIYRPQVLDAVVERVLSQWLAEQLSGCWPDVLYSYRPGVSSTTAIRAFASYLRRYRASKPDARSRALWVLRRDIKSYGSSIPLDDRLWQPLDNQLSATVSNDIGKDLLHAFLPRSFLPARSGGSLETLKVGTPTGASVQPTINNFFLLPLDTELAKQPGFYARFGDDILFACESQQQAEAADEEIRECIGRLGLRMSEGKCQEHYFNGAGHVSPSPAWPSCTSVDFLGVSVAFDGSIGLRKDKARRFRNELTQRLRTSADASPAMSVSERVRQLSTVVRTAITLSHPLALRDSQAICCLVDDRKQLRDLDRWLQRLVVELVLRRGIGGFRLLPPRQLYQLGLPSFVLARNARSTSRLHVHA